jgi:hypothetical protein
MLSAKRLPEILRTALDDGVLGACLMTVDGSVLCSVSDKSSLDTVNETALAAISSAIMNNYIQGQRSFEALYTHHIFELILIRLCRECGGSVCDYEV